jgi:predicted HAD superfamily phosphohydrolase YqeG
LTTTAVTTDAIRGTGASVIALDYDGVLAPHGVNELSPDVMTWLIGIVSVFGDKSVFILSNKPKASRCAYFHIAFPDIVFVARVRKKPFPDGLLAIKDKANCRLSDIVLLDDRLLTGGLATCIAGTKFIYIKKPLISLAHNFIAEVFFIALRSLERALVLMTRYF